MAVGEEAHPRDITIEGRSVKMLETSLFAAYPYASFSAYGILVPSVSPRFCCVQSQLQSSSRQRLQNSKVWRVFAIGLTSTGGTPCSTGCTRRGGRLGFAPGECIP